jgi:hypothetical protein
MSSSQTYIRKNIMKAKVCMFKSIDVRQPIWQDNDFSLNKLQNSYFIKTKDSYVPTYYSMLAWKRNKILDIL